MAPEPSPLLLDVSQPAMITAPSTSNPREVILAA
jgi:hypothetical protein